MKKLFTWLAVSLLLGWAMVIFALTIIDAVKLINVVGRYEHAMCDPRDGNRERNAPGLEPEQCPLDYP